MVTNLVAEKGYDYLKSKLIDPLSVEIMYATVKSDAAVSLFHPVDNYRDKDVVCVVKVVNGDTPIYINHIRILFMDYDKVIILSTRHGQYQYKLDAFEGITGHVYINDLIKTARDEFNISGKTEILGQVKTSGFKLKELVESKESLYIEV